MGHALGFTGNQISIGQNIPGKGAAASNDASSTGEHFIAYVESCNLVTHFRNNTGHITMQDCRKLWCDGCQLALTDFTVNRIDTGCLYFYQHLPWIRLRRWNIRFFKYRGISKLSNNISFHGRGPPLQ